MQKIVLRLTAIALFLILLPPPRALAVSREIVELQTQVQQLQDMLQHLQTSNDERMGVIINLVQQNTDTVNKMAGVVGNLETELKTANDATASSNTQLSTQIQALNDSVDELKSRLANLTTQMQAVQSQLQNVNSPPPSQPATNGSTQPGIAPTAPQEPGAPAATPQPDATLAPQAAPAPQAPPVDQLYQSALRDYNSARYPLAASEFGDVIHYYPQDPLAGNSEFYLGEISYRQKKYEDAVKHYDRVLEEFAGNPKAPASQLHKGESLLVLGQKEAGVRELRALVVRYPQTPEAQAGRSRLNGMGVRINPSKPSPYQQ